MVYYVCEIDFRRCPTVDIDTCNNNQKASFQPYPTYQMYSNTQKAQYDGYDTFFHEPDFAATAFLLTASSRLQLHAHRTVIDPQQTPHIPLRLTPRVDLLPL